MSRASSAVPKQLLVTGAGGYVGLNVIKLLAKEPHKIRASVRNVDDKKKTGPIEKAAAGMKFPVEFIAAKLLKLKGVEKN